MSSTLQTVKEFVFSVLETSQKENDLHVKITETADAHYSLYVWPCAVVLAQYIWYHQTHVLSGKHVLEIGSGTSLPSIVAAKCGKPASVTITDDESYLRCFDNCRHSLKLNGLDNVHDHILKQEASNATTACPIHLMGLTWGQVNPHLVSMVLDADSVSHQLPDVILGSDCFYDESLFEDAISTVYYLLKSRASQNPEKDPEFLCTYQVRSCDWSIPGLLHQWGLAYEDIPLGTFDADRDKIAGSDMPGVHKIEMMKITLR